MHSDPKMRKEIRFTTKVNEYTAEEIMEACLLSKMSPAKFTRKALKFYVANYHKKNSIGRLPVQPDFLSDQEVV